MVKGHCYAVIMAGGQGTRFWPLSRRRRPKQVLKILGGKSLIQETLSRILPLFGRDKILVVTVKDQYSEIRKQLPFLPKNNFLIEPQGNNTAPCIGLAAMELAARDPKAIMTVLPADHWISNPVRFRRTLNAALSLTEFHESLLTLGIRPSHPETGYGYILKGRAVRGPSGLLAHQVKAFKEKPNLREATRLVKSGSLWNSGIFVWKVSTLFAMMQRFAPRVYLGLHKIKEGTQGKRLTTLTPGVRRVLQREYKKMPNISIDHAVLEKAGSKGKVLTMEAKFPWSDLGSWAALHEFLPKDKKGNAAIGQWLGIDSRGCLVYSRNRLVVLIGMQGVTVVDTPDALLVGDINRAQDIRKAVSRLERYGHGKLVK